jgi:hypothetical protein
VQKPVAVAPPTESLTARVLAAVPWRWLGVLLLLL